MSEEQTIAPAPKEVVEKAVRVEHEAFREAIMDLVVAFPDGTQVICKDGEEFVRCTQVAAAARTALALEGIAKFIAGTTLPQALESHAMMACIGHVMNGLTANKGRTGLDASTIKQDAIDISHRVAAAFDHMRQNVEARKRGDFREPIIDAERDFKESGDGKRGDAD